jgi:hypothetical protein
MLRKSSVIYGPRIGAEYLIGRSSESRIGELKVAIDGQTEMT